jgi:Methane oxygenase PmoA
VIRVAAAWFALLFAAAVAARVVGAPPAFAAEPTHPSRPAVAKQGFYWANQPEKGMADLLYDGRPVLRYLYAFDRSTPERTQETFKVFHHVFGPGTGDLLTKGDRGGLYHHHRGLFVGWLRTRFPGGEIDSWHCKRGAHQRHVRFLEQTADAKSGFMSSEISWEDGNDQPVLDEIRSVRVRCADNQSGRLAWQIDWSSRLSSRRGPVELSGDRQHAGFQFRAAQSVADSKSARYVRPVGFPTQPQAFEVDDRKNPGAHVNLGWLAMSFPIQATQYTVLYFEDPSLPKPSRFSERPYGRFGAFFEAKITPEHPLTLRYRVIVMAEKPPSREVIQSAYNRFVAQLSQRKQAKAEK